jgi:MFS family permease
MTPQKPLSLFALLLLVTGQLLPQFDFSVVNVALDTIKTTLHTDETGLVLIVSLYGLSFATLIATGARLGDRFGRQRLFLLGTMGFCIASAICGLADNIIPMLIGRVFQGICAALLMPQILATIHATLEGERHSRAVSIYTSVAGLSVAFGQSFGGWLVSANLFGYGWRIAFFINIPVCLLILILGSLFIPETRAEKSPHMDIGGIILFALFLLCLLIPVAMAGHWPQLWWLCLALLPLGLGLWRVEIDKERKGTQPLLPPSLFQRASVIQGFIAEMAVTFTYSGYLFVTALCLQSALHFIPHQSGNTFMSLGAMFFVGSIFSKSISQSLGNQHSFSLGGVITLLGFITTTLLLWVFKQQLQVWHLIFATGLVGFGNALMLTSAFRITLSQVTQQLAGEASSALVTVQQGCFALGAATSGAIYAAVLSHGYLAAITASIGVLCIFLLTGGSLLYYRNTNNTSFSNTSETQHSEE